MAFRKVTFKEVSVEELLDEIWKTITGVEETAEKVLIKADPKKIKEQQQDIKIVEGLIDEVKKAEDHDSVFIHAAITVGYANAMQIHGTITDRELKRLNAMIGTIAERRLAEVGRLERKKFFDRLLHFGKVGA